MIDTGTFVKSGTDIFFVTDISRKFIYLMQVCKLNKNGEYYDFTDSPQDVKITHGKFNYIYVPHDFTGQAEFLAFCKKARADIQKEMDQIDTCIELMANYASALWHKKLNIEMLNREIVNAKQDKEDQ
jgi:hypothetical protein